MQPYCSISQMWRKQHPPTLDRKFRQEKKKSLKCKKQKIKLQENSGRQRKRDPSPQLDRLGVDVVYTVFSRSLSVGKASRAINDPAASLLICDWVASFLSVLEDTSESCQSLIWIDEHRLSWNMPRYRINFKTGSHYFLSASVISFVFVNITLLKSVSV